MTKLLKIYGERNTNTNYISKLIHLNLDIEEIRGVVPAHTMKMQQILPGNELIRDFYFFLTYKQNLGWKHTRVRPASKIQAYAIMEKNVSFLTITKNPYSWLLSLHRNPYAQNHKNNLSFEEFLCTPWKTVRRDNCPKILSNPVELWNLKNRSYLQLAGFNSLNITTESLFKNPKAVIDNICTLLSIYQSSNHFVNLEASTKDSSKNFTFYQDYYLNEKWQDNLSENTISLINQNVDKKLMDHFGYNVLP